MRLSSAALPLSLLLMQVATKDGATRSSTTALAMNSAAFREERERERDEVRWGDEANEKKAYLGDHVRYIEDQIVHLSQEVLEALRHLVVRQNAGHERREELGDHLLLLWAMVHRGGHSPLDDNVVQEGAVEALN